MKSNPREYRTGDIAVTYDAALCIHAAECVRGLRAVFDTEKRPWIQPENASADEIAAVIHRCPSGALTYQRLDGGPAEVPDPEQTIQPQKDGPLYVRGELMLRDAEGGTLANIYRAALCRCGASENKPFCDNSHIAIGFTAP
jgi:uncharacterized Fe-S cluster protein YjdI